MKTFKDLKYHVRRVNAYQIRYSRLRAKRLKEISRNFANNAIGSNVHEIAGSGTVLWGCEDSGGGFPNYDIRSGLVYYGGELYFNGCGFTVPIGKVAVCTITTSL